MTDDDRLAYLIDLIRHRCPELGPDDLALLAQPPDDDRLPAGITDQVLNLISMMSDRLDRMEASLEPPRLN